MKERFYISTELGEMDQEFIHRYLSEHSYWAKGRSLENVKKSMAHSLCFGIFTNGRQVGFGRVATDFVVFAWLMDLFIDAEYRGKGLGQRLINSIVNHPDLQEVNGIGLRTEDAQELYRKFGFEPISDPGTWMLRKKD